MQIEIIPSQSQEQNIIKLVMYARASAENFPGGGGNGKKDQKLAKYTENSTI